MRKLVKLSELTFSGLWKWTKSLQWSEEWLSIKWLNLSKYRDFVTFLTSPLSIILHSIFLSYIVDLKTNSPWSCWNNNIVASGRGRKKLEFSSNIHFQRIVTICLGITWKTLLARLPLFDLTHRSPKQTAFFLGLFVKNHQR